jgi:hypothetical protein
MKNKKANNSPNIQQNKDNRNDRNNPNAIITNKYSTKLEREQQSV